MTHPTLTALKDMIDHWGTTADERQRRYPDDDLHLAEARVLFRAITIDAPVAVVFRWLCQLKVAPYSYDLLDNRGRRSPRHLVPGVERLVVGERVMMFRLESFSADEHLTLRVQRHRLFGDVVLTYVVVPTGEARSRLIVKIRSVAPPGVIGLVMRRLLPAGDLIMMRRQLLNFSNLAQATTPVELGLSQRRPLSHKCHGAWSA